jgi:hypothetical protein
LWCLRAHLIKTTIVIVTVVIVTTIVTTDFVDPNSRKKDVKTAWPSSS